MSKKNAIFWDDKSSNEVLDEAERLTILVGPSTIRSDGYN